MHRAESLAYQLVQARYGAQREPASAAETALNQYLNDEGQIGIDGWGRPFKFKVIRSKSDQKQIMVWSLGPNGRDENSSKQMDSEQLSGPLSLSGDDLGTMLLVQ